MNVTFDKRLLIGLGSGLVSGLILASAARGSLVGYFILYLISPLPIAITGLGWGWPSALAASIAAAFVVGIGIAPAISIHHLIQFGLPITGLCYLALLHRDRNSHPDAATPTTPAQEWYPVGRVLAAMALIAGGLTTLSLLLIASSLAGLEAQLRALFDKMLTGPIALPPGVKLPSPMDLDEQARSLAPWLGILSAIGWMTLAVLNFWLGGHVCRMSGRLARPWPDLSTIIAPRELSLAFIVAVGLSFLPDYPGLIASGFAAAIMLVYVLIGLAILHNISRGSPVRPLLLFAAYAVLVLLQPLSSFILAVIALAERYLPFRRQGPFDAEYPPPPPT